jgi:flagellar basal body-associated protein FliL
MLQQSGFGAALTYTKHAQHSVIIIIIIMITIIIAGGSTVVTHHNKSEADPGCGRRQHNHGKTECRTPDN